MPRSHFLVCIHMAAADRTWSLGFWRCFEEPVPCSLSLCCLCCGVGIIQYENEMRLDGKSSLTTCLAATFGCCFGMAWNRGKLRTALGLNEAYWRDCGLYALCCYPCLSVQEYTEANATEAALQSKDN